MLKQKYAIPKYVVSQLMLRTASLHWYPLIYLRKKSLKILTCNKTTVRFIFIRKLLCEILESNTVRTQNKIKGVGIQISKGRRS